MLWDALELDMARIGTVALVGAGGKTTLMYALALEALGAGRAVVISTTTRILSHPHLPVATCEAELEITLRERGFAIYARPVGGKLSPPEGLYERRGFAQGELVLIEADGSKGLPLKAPAEHEPVIPPYTDAVIALAGLSAVGERICGVCHRPELVCGILNKALEDLITPEDIALLLASKRGSRKNVSEHMAYRSALNQCEGGRGSFGLEIAEALKARGIYAALTSFAPDERNGLNWYVR